MNRTIFLLAALLGLCGAEARAQGDPTMPLFRVVTSCGAQTLPTGQQATQFAFIDITGDLCVAATVTATATTTATASATPTPVSAGTGKPLNIDLFSGLFVAPEFAGQLVDGTHGLPVNCITGCSSGSTSNASSGVATSSTNGAAVAWNYGFNGTTWDQLQVDGSKNLKVDIAAGAVAATQSGTWNITNITGTVSLPTNAAQETGGNLATLAGGVTSSVYQENLKQVNGVALGSPSNYGTSPGAVSVPGVNAFVTNTVAVNEAQIAGTTTSVGNGTTDNGTARVTLSSDSTGQVKLATGANIAGKVGIDQTTDVTTNGVEIAPTAGSAAGITPVVSSSAENNHVLKASAGNLYSAYATNLTSTAGFLVILNATSSPADGAITPLACVPLPASGVASISNKPGPAQVYSTGITAVVTSASTCFTKTTGVITAFISGDVK